HRGGNAGGNAMRARATALVQVGLRPALPGPALARALVANPPPPGRVRLVALAEAAVGMAEAALARLDRPPVAALAVTNAENARDLPGVEVMAAGHPVPDASGLAAAARVEALLAAAGPGEQVLALISGGGSALLPAPA